MVAKLLEYYILHGKDDNAVATIMNSLPDSQAYLKDEIDAILKEKSTPHQNVIQKFGQGCCKYFVIDYTLCIHDYT